MHLRSPSAKELAQEIGASHGLSPESYSSIELRSGRAGLRGVRFHGSAPTFRSVRIGSPKACAHADERGPEIPRKNRHLVVAVGTPQDSTSAEREANATTERGSQE